VGDDVYGEDPTVNALETKIAQLFGMESAIFCASGTQSNQIAIRTHTQPGCEVICDRLSHIYNYEAGAAHIISGISMRLVAGNQGRFCANDVVENINPDNIHSPITTLVEVENTCNKGGGAYYRYSDLVEIKKVCDEHKLQLHLDGARIFNALVETGETPQMYGQLFDSISVCLSKGLGAPVGSLLVGSSALIHKARRVRKILGGAMRQAGYLAAAGIYALDHHVERLRDDHRRARIVADALQNCAFVEEILPVDTNILIFKLKKEYTTDGIMKKLASHNIFVSSISAQAIRIVTHLDFTDDMLTEVVKTLKNM